MRRALAVLGAVLVLGAWGPCAPPMTSGGDSMAGPTTTGLAGLIAGEDWHYVGETDEPAFENGWTNISADKYRLAFRIRETGVVDVEGLIDDNGAGSSSVFTLPEGYRPASRSYMLAEGTASGAHFAARVVIEPTGVLTIEFDPAVTATDLLLAGQFYLTPPSAP